MIPTAELKTEMAKPKYAGLENSEIVRMLNAPTLKGRRPVPKARFLLVLAKQGILAKLDQGARNDALSAPLQSACMALLRIIDSPRGNDLDMSDRDIAAMVTALVNANRLTAADRAAMIGEADDQPISFAVQTWGEKVSLDDVRRARR